MEAEPSRVERLRAKLKRLGADSFFVASPESVRYITGFTGADSGALVTPDETILVTDSRFRDQAPQECPGVRVVLRRRTLAEATANLAKKLRLRRLAFAAERISHRTWQVFEKILGRSSLISAKDLVLTMRMVKDKGELARIERALRVAEDAFRQVSSGRTESDFARRLDDRMRRLGAQDRAFETIVAAGARAALPHATATDAAITGREPVLVDWGARVAGYNSDLTRLRAPHRIHSAWKKLYKLVNEAGLRAIEGARPGMRACQLDAIARKRIERGGFGKAFLHGLGHGVGLSVHELPVVGPRSRVVLRPGMVLTVEPGVYLPGEIGIRVEDMILITPDGARRLGGLSRRLESLRLGN